MKECIYCDLEENHIGFHTLFMNRSPTGKDIHRTVPRTSASMFDK